MSGRLFVVNPNSSRTVTAAIDAGISRLRRPDGPEIICRTLAEGPPGIESQLQADRVIEPLLRHCLALEPEASGFVIACFGDPGLHALRDATAKPVLGIAECAVLTAMSLGQRFGVISILPPSVPRHIRYFGAMGVLDRLAGDLPLGLGVAELADADRTLGRMIETGRRLRDAHLADVLIMGCAGMAAYRDRLEQETSLPVVEPTQAAVAMALGQIALGWRRRPRVEGERE
ncbi:aspartate/glutamate racemase family protein [Limibaculum sp. FT325]|uniref:aspartate/glutamate racemase family protein n=1 Tax=Thermohalobaculum sediminis TaxID=2939436 RepID=UPI0020BF8716|nr:aspartate/glutamate racemase family protein [Limibaculum sediminis]MCL5779028.1 aspartate/glutamate racemase family protein [Limibaculum sediminis]